MKAQLQSEWRQIYRVNAFIRGFETRHYVVHPRSAQSDRMEVAPGKEHFLHPPGDVDLGSSAGILEPDRERADADGPKRLGARGSKRIEVIFVPNTFVAVNMSVRTDDEACGDAK